MRQRGARRRPCCHRLIVLPLRECLNQPRQREELRRSRSNAVRRDEQTCRRRPVGPFNGHHQQAAVRVLYLEVRTTSAARSTPELPAQPKPLAGEGVNR